MEVVPTARYDAICQVIENATYEEDFSLWRSEVLD